LYRILLIVIALIVYGSLYPWDFHSPQLAANPLWILLHSLGFSLDRFALKNILINIVLYMPLGMFAFLAFLQRRRQLLSIVAALLLALGLSSFLEIVQLFDRTRDCSALDVVCNVSGAAAGIALAGLYRETLRRAISQRMTEMLFHPSGALLLLYCWLGYQVFPLFPAFSRTRVALKLAALSSATSFSVLPAFTSVAQWLAVAKLLETVAGPKRVRTLMAALLPLVPLRLLIADRTFTWPELVGAVLAFAIWNELPGEFSQRTSLLAALFALMLAVHGLSPFHFQHHAALFSWVPFRASLMSEWNSGFVVFLLKSFSYGSAIWLLREAGADLLYATTAICSLLAAIEVVQIYLPGRTPEISDPLLAAIMAVILWLLERHHHAQQATLRI
jgi:VanZ family protein